ncbi:TULIP family P47-like protein [Hymenobacter negativus]|uniref:TULIP family P47-like protein n=1 Tax=Hymenobacter negativus TaxID=2795026 RepID=A0ABS3QK61_9BACT|nr:TULIP family P47-like protein [Hymenobacter negativus]MBO2011378.1 TULIP family P47-like protein [Hymenobacter negativus]
MSTTTNPPPAAQLADTYGWDTAYALTIPQLNAAIVKQGSSPTTFAYSQGGVSISGTFGAWQVCRGGDGKLLHMLIPMPTLTAVSGTTTLDYTNGSCVIELHLQYVPHTVADAKASMGTFHQLMVKYLPDTSAPNNPAVSIVTMTFAGMDFVTNALVSGVLQSWFEAHIADFAYIFAEVNLNREADQGQFQWLMPTYTDYAYLDGPTDDTSVLGILCMTSDNGTARSPTGLVEQLSPNAIPLGSEAGFLISSERFLTQLILPLLPTIFPGATVADFAVAADDQSISLLNPVKLQEVESDGSTYSPLLTGFTLSLLGQQITMDATTKTTIVLGIDAYAQSTYVYELVLTTTGGGAPSLNFQPVGTPVTENWTEQTTGSIITEAVAAVVVVVVGIVVTVMSGGTDLLAAGIVIGLLVGVVMVTPELIETLGTDDAPSVNDFILNATDPIKWTDEDDFALNYASLNGSLQLGSGSLNG